MFKPVVKATQSPLLALGASFFLIMYWHSPLPFAFESPSGLAEDDWDNYHVVKAMIVFGLGNFLGTFLDGACEGFPLGNEAELLVTIIYT